ncbi:MAG: CbbQ/NirQ/NorQ/GpvN family protein [Burkholderiaceae bacterium]|jgi:nitric oxide reductase NorQ protein|nr:CbbQ/NirQ/NorQ/GpvN family protein [Burkholderiaceae bacterium]
MRRTPLDLQRPGVTPVAAAPANDVSSNYIASGNEIEVFERAFARRLPLLIKGPTGCGKTRFVEHMAERLGVPMWTVSCNEDTSAADLVGRYILRGTETPWIDGPLTQAVRQGGICYLDEVVEARQEAIVILNSLADYRRTLFIDKTAETLRAPAHFMLVASYNPGYQSTLRDLKESVKQRFVAIHFDYPSPPIEARIVATESGCGIDLATALTRYGVRARELVGNGLFEGVSTRMLIHAAALIDGGELASELLEAALVDPITDDPNVRATLRGLLSLVKARP